MPQFEASRPGRGRQYGSCPLARRMAKKRTTPVASRSSCPISATPDAHGYGALETNEQSPSIAMPSAPTSSRQDGTVKYVKIMDSPLSLLSADECSRRSGLWAA